MKLTFRKQPNEHTYVRTDIENIIRIDCSCGWGAVRHVDFVSELIIEVRRHVLETRIKERGTVIMSNEELTDAYRKYRERRGLSTNSCGGSMLHGATLLHDTPRHAKYRGNSVNGVRIK